MRVRMRAWSAAAGMAVAAATAAAVERAEAEEGDAPAPAAQEKVALFETGIRSPSPYTADAMAARAGWKTLASGQTAKPGGDVVVANSAIALVFRRLSANAEVYAVGSNSCEATAVLVPMELPRMAALDEIAIVNNDEAQVELDAAYRTGSDGRLTVRYELGCALPMVRARATARALSFRVEAPSRFGVLPDFFADDTLIDACALGAERVEIPDGHLFMNMLDGGRAIVATVWDSEARAVTATLSGSGELRAISGVEVPCEAGQSVWLAMLAEPGIWTQADIGLSRTNEAVSLAWSVPFDARWQADFVRVDRTVDSWSFQRVEPGDNRMRWSSVIGWYPLPCWFAGGNIPRAGIRPPVQFPRNTFAGPFLAYPIERTDQTPMDRSTIADLLRNSIGIGPAREIVDSAALRAADPGLCTRAPSAMAPAIFAAKRQKEERFFLDRMLKEVQTHVKAIDNRINAYVEFRKRALAYLAEQKTARPELSEFIGRLEADIRPIPETKADRTAAVAEQADRIRAEALADVSSESISALTAASGEGMANHGLWQDRCVATCRNATRMARQTAAVEMLVNPKARDVAREIRERTQGILPNAYAQEIH